MRKRSPDLPSPLGRYLAGRDLSYDVAAEMIRRHHQDRTGRPLRLRGGYMGQLVRGDAAPSLALAKAIVAWSGGALRLDDLLDLSVPGLPGDLPVAARGR